MRAALVVLLCALSAPAVAKPSQITDIFAGDRYVRVVQSAHDVTRAVGCPPPACQRRAGKKLNKRATGAQRTKPHPTPRPRPGTVAPLTMGSRNIFRGFAETLRDAGPSKSLAGVVAPLAAKAREIQATCGSRVISAIRHTYIAGTGGRLSLHASGRAVDIVGNPSCIYAQLRGWPGGVSVDYGRVRHVHFSYAPGGSEWGVRFNHYRGGRRHRHARRRA